MKPRPLRRLESVPFTRTVDVEKFKKIDLDVDEVRARKKKVVDDQCTRIGQFGRRIFENFESFDVEMFEMFEISDFFEVEIETILLNRSSTINLQESVDFDIEIFDISTSKSSSFSWKTTSIIDLQRSYVHGVDFFEKIDVDVRSYARSSTLVESGS